MVTDGLDPKWGEKDINMRCWVRIEGGGVGMGCWERVVVGALVCCRKIVGGRAAGIECGGKLEGRARDIGC